LIQKPQSPLGLPVLLMVPFCLPAVAHTPAGRMEFIRSYSSFPFGFPETAAGRLLQQSFPGLLSVYSRYGLHARQVANATFCTQGFSSFVASAAASITTGWSEPVPGRVHSRCGPPPFTAHPVTAYRDLPNTPVEPTNRNPEGGCSCPVAQRPFPQSDNITLLTVVSEPLNITSESS